MILYDIAFDTTWNMIWKDVTCHDMTYDRTKYYIWHDMNGYNICHYLIWHLTGHEMIFDIKRYDMTLPMTRPNMKCEIILK